MVQDICIVFIKVYIGIHMCSIEWLCWWRPLVTPNPQFLHFAFSFISL